MAIHLQRGALALLCTLLTLSSLTVGFVVGRATAVSTTASASTPAKPPSGVPHEIVHDGVAWQWKRPVTFVEGWKFFDGHEYACESPDFRLLDLKGRKNLYIRALFMQALRQDGKYVHHGLAVRWMDNGLRDETRYENGVRQGIHRLWHANGKLSLEETILFDEPHGPAKGWDDTGKPTWESVYEHGKEVSGRSLD